MSREIIHNAQASVALDRNRGPHLAVRRDYRGRGIAKRLVELWVAALRGDEIIKCNVCVVDGNSTGLDFCLKFDATLLHYDWRTLQFYTEIIKRTS